MKKPIFLSVGRPGDAAQKEFLATLEEYLRSMDLEPQTLDSTVYKADPNPLGGIASCLRECIGMVVLAYERIDIISGLEKGTEALEGVRVTTVWNHIEASLAFAHDLPVLVLVEEGIRLDGLLGNIYGWKVLPLRLDKSELYTKRIADTLRDWQNLCDIRFAEKQKSLDLSRLPQTVNFEKMTIPQLLGQLAIPHIWALVVGLASVLMAVATLAYKVGKH